MLLSACNNSQSTLVIVRNFQNEGRREYQRVCVCVRETEREREREREREGGGSTTSEVKIEIQQVNELLRISNILGQGQQANNKSKLQKKFDLVRKQPFLGVIDLSSVTGLLRVTLFPQSILVSFLDV